MEDRELLELAAEASGFWICQDAEYLGCEPLAKGLWVKSEKYGNYRQWNPLEDDGDAFRLSSSLDICLRLMGDEITGIAHWHKNGKTSRVVGTYHTGDSGEARRLVVRAAAEIGKTMP